MAEVPPLPIVLQPRDDHHITEADQDEANDLLSTLQERCDKPEEARRARARQRSLLDILGSKPYGKHGAQAKKRQDNAGDRASDVDASSEQDDDEATASEAEAPANQAQGNATANAWASKPKQKPKTATEKKSKKATEKISDTNKAAVNTAEKRAQVEADLMIVQFADVVGITVTPEQLDGSLLGLCATYPACF